MDKSITIHGPGPDHLTVDGNHASGVFRVQLGGGGAATIAGLTITNGNANRGGGISNEFSMLTVSNCTISGNSAPDVFGVGGGIYNDVCLQQRNAGGSQLHNQWQLSRRQRRRHLQLRRLQYRDAEGHQQHTQRQLAIQAGIYNFLRRRTF